MLWVVIKRETGDQRRENRGGRGEKVGARGRKKNGEGNNIEREKGEESGGGGGHSVREFYATRTMRVLSRKACTRLLLEISRFDDAE